jgi:hypothetical protein
MQHGRGRRATCLGLPNSCCRVPLCNGDSALLWLTPVDTIPVVQLTVRQYAHFHCTDCPPRLQQ